MKKRLFGAFAVPLIAVLFAGCGPSASSTAVLPVSGSAAFPDKHNNSFVQTFERASGTVYLYDGDGGWNDVTPPDIPARERVSDGLFLDRNTGWAASWDWTAEQPSDITVYRTSDGGDEWKASTIRDIFVRGLEMDFVSADDGWMLVHQDAWTGGEAVTVLRTTDGGAAWTAVSVSNGLDAGSTADSLPGKTSIVFYDADVGYAPMNNASYSIILYATRDGGQTWRQESVPFPDAGANACYCNYTPVFFPDGEGILPIIGDRGGDSYTLYLYTAPCAGAAWSLSSEADGLVPEGGLYGLCLRAFSSDGKSGYVTDCTSIFSLRDGKWTRSALPALRAIITNAYPSKMMLTDENTLWFAYEFGNYTLKSTDGGHTWVKVQIP